MRDIFSTMETAEILRRRIISLLRDRGHKQCKFGEVVGRGPAWVSMFLRGERPFPFDRIDDVAKFFHNSVDMMLAPLTAEELKRSSESLKSFRRSRAAR